MVDEVKDTDEERYRLTPWGCLYAVLKDYKIDCDWVSGKVGEHIVDDFMGIMERCGYVSKAGD